MIKCAIIIDELVFTLGGNINILRTCTVVRSTYCCSPGWAYNSKNVTLQKFKFYVLFSIDHVTHRLLFVVLTLKIRI